ELRLRRHAGGASLRDQGAAVVGDRGGCQLSCRRSAIAWRLPLPGQFGRVGVEAETDLTAALLDERRESIGERDQRLLSL
ncbi:MAG TPA: hypothetical protein VGI67_18870, partial [Thermoleophilaceae bacterium]